MSTDPFFCFGSFCTIVTDGQGSNYSVEQVSLLFVLIYGWPLLVHDEELEAGPARICWWFGVAMIWMLYMWELHFRVDINPSLLVHHLCTLALVAIFMGFGITGTRVCCSVSCSEL